jgi:hypothetical protein
MTAAITCSDLPFGWPEESGARADKAAGTLSGGERFRAVLAALLLAEPPPQLLAARRADQ